MDNEFIIIKYYESLLGTSDVFTKWAKVTAVKHGSEYCAHMQELSHHDAVLLIDKAGLVLAKENKHGKIWDTPDNSFQSKYAGIIDTRVD